MSAATVTDVYIVGGAVLGLWLATRCVSFRPRTLRGAFVLTLLAAGIVEATAETSAAAEAVAGRAAALLLVLLPSLVFAFWAAAQLLRIYFETVGRVSR